MIKNLIVSVKKIIIGLGIRVIIFIYLCLYLSVFRFFSDKNYVKIDRFVSRLIRKFIAVFGIKIRVHGKIPEDNKIKIIACQHQGGMETIVGLDIFGNSVYIFSEHLFKIPISKKAFSIRKGHVVVSRNNAFKDSLRIKKWIKENQFDCNPDREISLVIFPEGRRMRIGEQTKMKGLVLMKKLLPKAKIYPITLNSGLLWTKFFDVNDLGVIDIRIHNPLPDNLSNQEINTKIEQIFYNK